MGELSVQQRYAPQSICFGCGPANAKGLRIESFESDAATGELVAEFVPQPHHEAFPGMLNGGIIGTLLDCHCNWTAAVFLMHRAGSESPPCTVTASYSVQLQRPTPSSGPLSLRAHVDDVRHDKKVQVVGTLAAQGKVCATCTGTFVAVEPGHPAYHRW